MRNMICKSCCSSVRNEVDVTLSRLSERCPSAAEPGSTFKSWSSPDLTNLTHHMAPAKVAVQSPMIHLQLTRKRSQSSDALTSSGNGCDGCLSSYSSETSTVAPSADGDVNHPAADSAQSRVSTTLSWDSGYNDAAAENATDTSFSPVDCYPVTGIGARTFRMPSVVVSDCSEEMCPSEQSFLNFNDQPSPTLSQCSNDMEPCWTWSPRHSLSASPAVDEFSKNLLAVRRLSDCSSSSSLGTLDMDTSLADPPESRSTFRTSEMQFYDSDVDNDKSAEETVKPPTTTLTATPQSSASSGKMSPWRKVRSAVQWSPFVQTFRRQRYPWVQLAGHQGNFKMGGEKGTILKKLCPKEENCFQLLMQDPLRPFIPQYKGHVVADDGEKFLVLEDLLGEFSNPAVMDCKLGVRTYLEEELAKAKLKPKLRKDMFDKMLQVDPTAPTAEELRLGGVTKPRYMVWRETISSTATLGFRIEGIRKQDGTSSKDFKTTRTSAQILAVFREFIKDQPHALVKYVERLRSLEKTLNSSGFFATHELIGSSLLLIHDHSKANVWMIDFAKTNPLPNGIQINHRNPWVVGNHEDGYLTGLHNLMDLFEQLLDERQGNH